MCECQIQNGIEAYSFWKEYTQNCFYSPTDVVAYICGIINIGFWMFAQFPQIYTTFKTKKPESLSIAFLVTWLLGDITNLLGCIFTNQTQVQLITSIYFCLVDIVMLWQYFWYLVVCRKKYHKNYEGFNDEENEFENEKNDSKIQIELDVEITESQTTSASMNSSVDNSYPMSTLSPLGPVTAISPMDITSESANSCKSDIIIDMELLKQKENELKKMNSSKDSYSVSTTSESISFDSSESSSNEENIENNENNQIDENENENEKQNQNESNKENNSKFMILLGLFVVLCASQLTNNETTTPTQNNTTEKVTYCNQTEMDLSERIIGDVSAWISGLLYFSGRIPQIFHIHKTKDVEGVSIFLFLMATIANFFYSISIFLSGIDFTSSEFYESTLAYIIGSLFVVPFSFVIIYQVLYYRYIKDWLQRRKVDHSKTKQEAN